ncbi:winged helix-turn-helix domain-containing protein [Micromonospora sp. NPDC005215]|uniref:winged helix-turn-helix domain-containing protein n=1 Tax=Micromonospora sp. NPDC005215 TaxID=3157024 RepID=UPI00339EC29C
MLERVRRQLDGVGQVVSCADLVQLRAMLFPSPNAPQPAVGPVPPEVVAQCSVEWGELVVDRTRQQVTWHGDPITLTPTERELLALLIGPPVVVWSYEQLFAAVWSGPFRGSAIVHSAIKKLRRKLRDIPGGPRVHAVRGIGYQLDPPPRST